MTDKSSHRRFAEILAPKEWISRGRVRLMGGWDVFVDAVVNFDKNGNANQAAAIALYSILSFIPMFILTIIMVNQILGAFPHIQHEMLEGVKKLSPYFSGPLLEQLGGMEEKKHVLGWVGIITLIWFSSMIFGAIETAMSMIFHSHDRRNYLASKLLAIAMIPAAWAVAVASIVVTSIMALLAKQPLLAETVFQNFPMIKSAFFQYAIPFLVTVLFFTILYKVIPTGKIPLGIAITGGAIFSALMEVAKHFFAWYVANYTRYNVIFGSLETVVILVIWVFYIALILLFCAELMASFMRRDLILLHKAFFNFKPGKKMLTTDERLFHKFGRIYPKNTYVFQEGDAGTEMYYILSGRIQLEKTIGLTRKILTDMGPGNYFGEIAALIEAKRTASAKASEDAELAVIDGDTFRSLLRESDEASLLMLKEFSHRIKRSNEALEDTTHSWLRLILILFFLKNDPLPRQWDPIAELASLTGKDDSEIGDILNELNHEGILKYQEGRIAGFDKEKAWQIIFK
ncbi:MAG: YhjD/YihY/BrkB family envelope integrity protein [Syntrophales bacterium]